MERILVSMEESRGAWEAWSRAISLAKRIEAKIYVLLVTAFGHGPGNSAALPGQGKPDRNGSPPLAGEVGGGGNTIRQRLELLIRMAKADNVGIEFFVSEGKYEEEVIRFIDQNRITLLVVESREDNRHSNAQSALIRMLQHRSSCRVEVVSLRKQQSYHWRRGNSK